MSTTFVGPTYQNTDSSARADGADVTINIATTQARKLAEPKGMKVLSPEPLLDDSL
jgi:hypothetical protein